MKQITEIHCSSLARPMVCAGSLFFDLPKQADNEFAKEGTAAGEYLEHLLLGSPIIPSAAKNGVYFDEDMRFYGKATAEEIKSKAAGEILCEQKIDWQTRSGIWIKGKYDASFVGSDGSLYIDDYKYGWNIVEAEENWQLLGYAIGEVIRRQEAFDTIVMRIHQPRPHHEKGPIREWEISYGKLLEYKEKIENRMDQIASGFSELVTSKRCKYCPAAAEACTAFNRSVFFGVDYVLSDFEQDVLSEKEISFQLDLLERVNEVLKIKSDSIKQLAVDRIKNGAILPGYDIVDSLGDRKWKKEITPLTIKTLTGIDITETVMLSPAKSEKLGVAKELVKNCVDRQFLGKKLTKTMTGAMADKIFNNKEK